MNPMKILMADDEAGIRNIMKEYMDVEGYLLTEAVDGVDALNKFKQDSYDLIILDVMMPKMEGWTVCREIRKVSKVPVIMLTARGEEYDKLFGFEMGVDDYVVKPFSPKEVMARVKALLSRSKQLQPEVIAKNELTIEQLYINFDARSVSINHINLTLSPKEYDLLRFFIQNPNIAFSREQLLTSVWGYDFYGDSRTVDTHIKSVREQLGAYRSWLVTVWGLGYKFEPEVKG